ncbi:zf-HC2 domain-containing protein [Acidothermaceae bacterium B102]|nr:zf-HC2 domain-containing protein [Acidothermaceae bacterium B102]
MTESHDLRFDLGAYVMGALTPDEREVIDAHLSSCPDCTSEMDELTRLPVLLDLLSAEEVVAMGTGAGRPPADLVDRVVAAAVAERRGQRRRRWLVASAAAVVLVAGSSAAAVVLSSSPSKTPAQDISLSATNKTTGTWARIEVEPRLWGASLNLKLTGVPAGEHCKLVAVGRDGSTETAGSWEVTYHGGATLTGATSLSLSSTASYDIVTFEGKTLVSVPTATS